MEEHASSTTAATRKIIPNVDGQYKNNLCDWEANVCVGMSPSQQEHVRGTGTDVMG